MRYATANTTGVLSLTPRWRHNRSAPRSMYMVMAKELARQARHPDCDSLEAVDCHRAETPSSSANVSIKMATERVALPLASVA
jgi:hypothetical protein